MGAQPKPLLVLASQSPRRKQLLEQLGRELDFEVQVLGPEPDEDAEGLEAVHVAENPLDYVQRVAHLKAEAGWRRMLRWTDGGFELPVLASDTTVALGDQVLGKPGSADEARKMLRSLSGRVHQVHTAVGLAVPVGSFTDVDAVHGQSDSIFDYVQGSAALM